MYVGEMPGAQSRISLITTFDRLREVWLWHRRLGHNFFVVMKQSMHSLFIGVDESVLHCETYVLGKSHRSTYSPRKSVKSVIPFELIHSHVWGPLKKPTMLGMRHYVSSINDFTCLNFLDCSS